MLRTSIIFLSTAMLVAFASARVGQHGSDIENPPSIHNKRSSYERTNSGAMYPLKERRLREATEHWTMADIKEKYMLTFNEDSPPKPLELFLLQLIETDGHLPNEPSLDTITTGLENFLTAELNALFAPTHKIQEIEATIKEQQAIADGSELLTSVEVTFMYEPSPEQAILELWVQSIMANLTMLVSNITSLADGDPELANLSSAQRAVYAPSDGGTSGIVSDKDPVSRSPNSDSMPYIIVPAVLAGVLLVGLIVLLSAQRSKKRRTQLLCFTAQDPNEHPSRSLARANLQKDMNNTSKANNSNNNTSGQISVFMEDDSDIFSIETGLIDSPAAKRRLESPTNKRSNAKIPKLYSETDLFSGLESGVTSPKNGASGASIFSFLSGLTNRSEATIPVSNTTTANSKSAASSNGYTLGISSRHNGTDMQSGTPHSQVGSLFAFSEEGEEDDDTDEEEDDDDDDETYPVPPVTSPKTPYDEEAQPEVVEDFLIDTASMNSETHMREHYDDEAMVSPKNGFNIPSPASAGPSPPVAAHSVEARFPDTEEEPMEVPKQESPKKGWFNFFGPKSSTKASRQNEPADDDSTTSAELNEQIVEEASSPMSAEVNVAWNDAANAQRNAAAAAAFVDVVKSNYESPTEAEQHNGRGRRHAKTTNTDGTEQYQRETMEHNPEWSIDEGTISTPSAGSPERREKAVHNSYGIWQAETGLLPLQSKTPVPTSTSKAKNESNISGLSSIQQYNVSGNASSSVNVSNSINTSSSLPFDAKASPSKQLVDDLKWLEKQLKGQVHKVLSPSNADPACTEPSLNASDSMSFTSESELQQPVSSETETSSLLPPRESIICRDCIAPPGKLKIIIHSTKDGPAVHTVKEGSALEGQIFPGDLIISVDNVDTRSYTAEQVMKNMTAKSKYERTITVLHIEQDS
ncbi:hypothetical protein MPSEU_000982000 [Mayamaea pseudoterrestris]|nr:hypothetical protein MPSEU_000982000 [Mayamaea pseudoterrestris]